MYYERTITCNTHSIKWQRSVFSSAINMNCLKCWLAILPSSHPLNLLDIHPYMVWVHGLRNIIYIYITSTYSCAHCRYTKYTHIYKMYKASCNLKRLGFVVSLFSKVSASFFPGSGHKIFTSEKCSARLLFFPSGESWYKCNSLANCTWCGTQLIVREMLHSCLANTSSHLYEIIAR